MYFLQKPAIDFGVGGVAIATELPGISSLFRLVCTCYAHYVMHIMKGVAWNEYLQLHTHRQLLMEEIEKLVVFPNKQFISLSQEVPMQVIIFFMWIFKVLFSNDTLGFQVSSSGGGLKDNPRGGKVRNSEFDFHLPGISWQKTSTEPQTPTVNCLLKINNGKARLVVEKTNLIPKHYPNPVSGDWKYPSA